MQKVLRSYRHRGYILPILLVSMACTKTKTVEKPVIIEVPKIQTVEVPVQVPGTNQTTQVPQTILIDKGLGIQSIPKEISLASENIQDLAKSVAKVMRSDGSSGSGFFISPDGLFITNEHVIPRDACAESRCPGIKIVLGFTRKGVPRVFSKFKVIAQDNLDKPYDFTVIKVELKSGETVPFLKLQLDTDQNNFSLQTAVDRYVAVGHPGGATLSFAQARPFLKLKMNINFQGLVIPGNSGGPLIDVETGLVVGLLKETRTAPTRVDANSATFETTSRATAMTDLLALLKNEVPNSELQTIPGFDKIQPLEQKSEGLYLPNASIPVPSVDLFSGLMRRSFDDMKVRDGLNAFDLYVGTPQETSVLDKMFVQSDYTPNEVQIDVLNKLLSKQLLVGRSFKFSSTALSQIQDAITLREGEETSSKMTSNILLNYFNLAKRNQFQQKCLQAFPQMSQIAPALTFVCASLKMSDDSSVVSVETELVKAASYQSIDDYGAITGFLMMASVVGLDNAKDRESVIELQDFADSKINDLEFLLQNDSFAMNLAKGLVGVGAFAETYPLGE